MFVPSHLRVLHVASEPLFYAGSLFDNLTFGCQSGDPDASAERVLEICNELGFPKHLVDTVALGPSGPGQNWGEVVSDSNKGLLTMARALIANPEFLCIHKPLKGLNKSTELLVVAALKNFCDRKGLVQDAETRHMR